MSKKNITDDVLDQAGKAMLVQKNQSHDVENQLTKLHSSLNNLSKINMDNLNDLDLLIMQAEMLCEQQNINTDNYASHIDEIVTLTEEKSHIQVEEFELLPTIGIDDSISWEAYMEKISQYAEQNHIDFSKDPFESLMTEAERAELGKRIREDYTMKQVDCDKYDYLIAGFCGVATGLIDAFFVGMPGDSKLGNWTDKKVDRVVEKFAQSVWKSDKKNGVINSKSQPEGIASAIGYLERRFRVNYDARYGADLNLGDDTIFNMSAKNHHLKSLGHAPDLIGLFFSILDQFTGKNSFISDGRIIRVEPIENKFELRGGNFFSKLFCGFCNWLGHIMSDIAGSSGTRGHLKNGRGAGVAIPFFEMFQLCNFGSFNVNGEQKTLAELSAHVFETGYDARHGATMAIPVVINEMMIRLIWAIKSRFYHGHSWKDSIPFGNKPELRRMLLVGHGSLCLVDGIDAGLRSGGNMLTFALRLNSVAWSRFAFAGLQEIRAIYNKNAMDISAIDTDLEREWNRLYLNV